MDALMDEKGHKTLNIRYDAVHQLFASFILTFMSICPEKNEVDVVRVSPATLSLQTTLDFGSQSSINVCCLLAYWSLWEIIIQLIAASVDPEWVLQNGHSK